MRKWWFSFTLIFLLLLAVDVYPGLRGGSGWRWPYAWPEGGWPLVMLAAILIIYLAGVFILRHRESSTTMTLLWSLIAGVMIALGVVGVRGDVGFLLFTRTVSPVQTGASTVAVNYMAEDGLVDTLKNWPEVMLPPSFSTTSPPSVPL